MKPCVLVCNINNLFGNFTMIYLLFLKELPFFVPFINGIGNFKTVWLQADTPQRFANTRSTEIPESKTQCDTNTPILVSLKVNIVVLEIWSGIASPNHNTCPLYSCAVVKGSF